MKSSVMDIRYPLIRVSVTARDVKRAREFVDKGYSDVLSCPVALAVTRAARAKFRRRKKVQARVEADTFELLYASDQERPWRRSKFASGRLPAAARKVVRRFDDRKKVEPVDFYLLLRTP